MSWADTIKQVAGKAGLVEVEDHVEAPAQAAPAPHEATQYPPAQKPVPQPPTDTDAALMQKLRGNVFQSTEPFVQFSTLEESLRSEISDERQRWRVSFKASRLTRGQLQSSLQNCELSLNGEATRFAASLKTSRDNDLQSKQEQVRIVSEQAASKRAELKALEAQYAELVADVSQTTARLDKVERQFKSAVESIKSELVANRANVDLEIFRNTCAMGWMLLPMAEGLFASEGGLGRLAEIESKHFNLAAEFAIVFVILLVGLAQDYLIGVFKGIVCEYSTLGLERGA